MLDDTLHVEEPWMRQRDLLPLPHFIPEGDPGDHGHPRRAGLSEGAYRRHVRRQENVCKANEAISAINSLAGFSFAKQGAPSEVQCKAMSGILKSICEAPRPNSFTPMREAVRELLHYRPSTAYVEQEETGTTTVRPYQRDLVSLPEPGARTLDAIDLVDDVGRDILSAFHDTMLRDVEKDPPKRLPGDITPYMDVKLKASSTLYEQFVLDLWDRNMLEFIDKSKSEVTPFFVIKKSGKLRMVLDCRASNAFFQDPPDIAMPAGYSFSQLEIPDGKNMFIAQTDVKDYCYSIGMPKELRPFFALPAVDLRRVIPNHPLCGQRHDDVLLMHPAMKVVPMGWNWAMFIAQRVHQHQSMLAAGLTMDRVLVDGRPSPSIAEDVAIIPYADNLNIVGCDQDKVQATKHIIVKHMESLGFRIHEEQEAMVQAESLGFFIDGRFGKVYPKPNKLQKVRKVLNWLAQRPRVSGKMLERIIGHCIHFCMLRRELLSVFRAVYDFKIIAYNSRQRLWKTAALECKCMAALLDLCFADLRRPWCQEVTASDASLTGTAVCSSHWGPTHIHQVGRQRELWRYRAVGGAGRAREHVQALDPFTDQETVRPPTPIASLVQPLDSFQLNLDFKEVPSSLLRVEDWTIDFSARMTMPEHITLLEGRGVVQALRHKARGSVNFGRRHIHLNDNLGMTLAFDRGRAKNKALLFQCRRSTALAIATHCEFHFRWIPSELNVADKPSRIFEPPRHASKRSTQRAIQEAIDPGSKIKTDKTRNQTGLRGQSFEEGSSSICGVVKDPHPSRSSKENCRQNGGGSQCKTAETGGRASKSSTTGTDLSRTVSNFSQDCRRLSDESHGVSKVLPVTQYLNNRQPELGCKPNNLLSAVFQRWHGICRRVKVFGGNHRQLARGRSKGQTTQGSTVAQRLEEPGPRTKSSANSVSIGGVDCSEHAGSWECGQRDVSADHVRGLFQANRDPSAATEGSGFVNLPGNDVHARSQPRRRLRDFQDGCGRREPQYRLQGSTMAGKSSGHVEQKPPSDTKAVPGRVQQFFGRLEEGPSKVQPASRTLNSLPAAPCRRQLGPLQRLQDTAGSKDERSLAVGQLHEQIRKEGISGDSFRRAPSAGSKALQRSNPDAAQQGPQHFGPMKGFHGVVCRFSTTFQSIV